MDLRRIIFKTGIGAVFVPLKNLSLLSKLCFCFTISCKLFNEDIMTFSKSLKYVTSLSTFCLTITITHLSMM